MLAVNEIFFSIQGEGTRAGRPSAFLRLTGCPLRCVWCDTAYAFHEGDKRNEEDVLAELARLPTRLLCLTGGGAPGAFPALPLRGPPPAAGRGGAARDTGDPP